MKFLIKILIFSTYSLTKFPEQHENVFDYDDVIIICGSFCEFCDVESHIHISNKIRK